MLVGFSMGTGEVTRYLRRYGSERVAKAVMTGRPPPFLLNRDDNPEGVDGQLFVLRLLAEPGASRTGGVSAAA